MPCITSVIPLCKTNRHSWQRKEQAESRQRVRWPTDANNLGDWGRPALINAGQPWWLSGGTVLGLSPMVVLVTPRLLPQSRPSGERFTPSHASLDPAHSNDATFVGGKDWPRLCQSNATQLTPHHHYCHLTLPPVRWFSILLLGIHTLQAYSVKLHYNIHSSAVKYIYTLYTVWLFEKASRASGLISPQHVCWKWEQHLQPNTLVNHLLGICCSALQMLTWKTAFLQHQSTKELIFISGNLWIHLSPTSFLFLLIDPEGPTMALAGHQCWSFIPLHTGLVLTPLAKFTDLTDCGLNAACLVFSTCPSRFATLAAQFPPILIIHQLVMPAPGYLP